MVFFHFWKSLPRVCLQNSWCRDIHHKPYCAFLAKLFTFSCYSFFIKRNNLVISYFLVIRKGLYTIFYSRFRVYASVEQIINNSFIFRDFTRFVILYSYYGVWRVKYLLSPKVSVVQKKCFTLCNQHLETKYKQRL